ncbi:MAG TPA: hypothetical protein VGU25_14740 [Acidobacteriaceae bacterium]|nr:hypothetical protein [Acidobacteriaceae bacterium]
MRLPFASALVCALFVLPAAGCKTSSTAAATAPSSAPSAASQPTQSAIPSTTTTATVTDPSMNNETAFTVTIPSGWKLDGTVTTNPCNNIPSPVFRAYASDGLTELRLMPIFGWRWSKAAPPPGANRGCLPLPGPMSAAQFAQYFVGTIQGGVHIIGPMPVSALVQQAAQKYADNMNAGNARLMPALQAHNTGDTAALHFQTVNGSFVIDQRVLVRLQCGTRDSGPLAGGGCIAFTEVLRAPQGKLDQLIQLVDSTNMPKVTPDPQWFSAVLQRQQRQGQAMLSALARQEQQESSMLHQQFEQSMQRMQANHEAFMQQQEASFHSSMNNANAAMNARSTAASDWVDYALDQQTVTGAGGTVKVSNAYGTTWSNGQGQWYQTNDVNSNPNGVLKGTWTQDTKVHGNGQPY